MSKQGKKGSKKASVRKPKKKCCDSRPKCSRCPLRMLKDGTLPEGFTVHKRRLVKTDAGTLSGPKEPGPKESGTKQTGPRKTGTKKSGRGKGLKAA